MVFFFRRPVVSFQPAFLPVRPGVAGQRWGAEAGQGQAWDLFQDTTGEYWHVIRLIWLIVPFSCRKSGCLWRDRSVFRLIWRWNGRVTSVASPIFPAWSTPSCGCRRYVSSPYLRTSLLSCAKNNFRVAKSCFCCRLIETNTSKFPSLVVNLFRLKYEPAMKTVSGRQVYAS